MSRATYSKVETGTRNIRISDFVLLKEILNAEYADFFEGLAEPG